MAGHGQTKLNREQVELRRDSLWTKLPIIGGVAAIIGLGGAFALSSGHTPIENAKFWSSYLTAFMFALSLGLGGMFFVILQHITRAQWSIVVRRLAEALMLSVPVVMLLGLPIFFFGGGHHEETDSHAVVAEHGEHGLSSAGKRGDACSAEKPCVSVLTCGSAGLCEEKHKDLLPGSHHIYEWTHESVVKNDPLLSAKAGYLNESAQKFRYFFYLIVWSVIAGLFWTWSVKQDSAKDPSVYTHRQRWFAPLALLFFALTITFCSFDFLMSLDPHWFSTIFGVYYFTGGAVTVHSLLVVLCALLQRGGYMHGVVTREHFHDLGKFMFGFTVFWAYIAFSQYFLIWYASVPEETEWFAYRGLDQWKYLSIGLVFGRFVFPWFALLRQGVKRSAQTLTAIAAFIIGMQYIDIYWLVTPAFDHHQSHYAEMAGLTGELAQIHGKVGLGLSDVLTLLGFAGVVTAVFGYAISRFPMVPLQDPRLIESLNHENR